MTEGTAPAAIPAAQYVRMSTEHQRYSADNQAAVIELYAAAHGYEVVQTYADLGRSGLMLEKRPALQQLLADVASGSVNYQNILVFDVSRWGRFQDPDEAAACELACKRAGIRVHYCAEPFDNDGGPLSSILKAIKRVMAAEYSRELSEKVFAAQRRCAASGYLACRWAPFGTGRMMVDHHGRHVRPLAEGERNLSGHRVTLVPGRADEVRCVRRMFRLYGRRGWTMTRIAQALNDDGLRTRTGKPWTHLSVGHILRCEAYIGNYVYGRTASKLGGPIVRVPTAEWTRAEGVFQPIIGRQLFADVQRRLSRTRPLPDAQMIDELARLLAKKGYLTRALIDAEPGMLGAAAYSRRFGTIAEAYRRVGFEAECHRAETAVQASFATRERLVGEVANNLVAPGRQATVNGRLARVVVDNSLTIDVRVCRPKVVPRHPVYWCYQDQRREPARLTLVVRLDKALRSLDFCLATAAFFTARRHLFLPAKMSQDGLEVFTSLDGLYERCLRLLGWPVSAA